MLRYIAPLPRVSNTGNWRRKDAVIRLTTSCHLHPLGSARYRTLRRLTGEALNRYIYTLKIKLDSEEKN